jgi:hypothetical protein
MAVNAVQFGVSHERMIFPFASGATLRSISRH